MTGTGNRSLSQGFTRGVGTPLRKLGDYPLLKPLDVARMMSVSGADVDRPTLDGWIERLRLGAEWAKALAYHERE